MAWVASVARVANPGNSGHLGHAATMTSSRRRAALAASIVAIALPILSAREDDDLAARTARIRAALRTADFDTARVQAERLKEDAPASADALAIYGDALWASGLFDEAETAYADALSRAPLSPRARYGVARGLATRNRTTEALDAVRAALAATPDDADAHGLAAGLYERLRRFDDAADEYRRYAALTPDDPTAGGTALARATFLRSFDGREPLSMKRKDRAASYTVPFKLVQNKVVVQGRINGSRVEWVLDTGAEHTGISGETALRTGVRPVTTTLTAGVGEARLRRIQLARIDTLEVGPLRLHDVPVSIRTPAAGGAPRWQHESLSPIGLGLSAVIDYQRREVTFAEKLDVDDGAGPLAGPHSTSEEIRLPLRVQRLPLVRGVLNATHPAYFVVDTGGELISIGSDVAEALDMHPPRRIPLRVFGLSGLDESAFLLPGVDLDFATLGYRKVGLAVLNLRAPSVLLGFRVGGIVGHKLLGNYRVALDVARSELRLTR